MRDSDIDVLSADGAQNTGRNEAAERLRSVLWDRSQISAQEFKGLLDAALAAERRATVERIRDAVNRNLVEGDTAIGLVHLDIVLDNEAAGHVILDEEAAR